MIKSKQTNNLEISERETVHFYKTKTLRLWRIFRLKLKKPISKSKFLKGNLML